MTGADKKIAVVTGANRGLGWAAAEALAKAGYHVVLGGRNEARLMERKKMLISSGYSAEVLMIDLGNSASIQTAVSCVTDRFPMGIDILINNAGICLGGKDSFDGEVIRSTLNTNALGPLELSLGLEPALKMRKASVVNVSSVMGRLQDMKCDYPGYRISKTALNAVTRILSDRWKDHGIRVNSVSPGWVRTDMGGPRADRSIEEGLQSILWAAMVPEGGPTGGFFRDNEFLGW